MIEHEINDPSFHGDEVDFLLTNPDTARISRVDMEEAVVNFGFYPDSPILHAFGAHGMSWQRMQHSDTNAEVYMAAPTKAEFSLHEALITMAIPHDKKRLPGNRIAGVVNHSAGIRQVVGLDYDQRHRRLNRIGFSDPGPDYDPQTTYAFSNNSDTFQPTQIGASYLTAGIFTEAMITQSSASSHMNGELLDHGLHGDIRNSLTSSQLAHYEMEEQAGFIVLKNSVWQLPPVIPLKLDQ
jgi:hypothetical protein